MRRHSTQPPLCTPNILNHPNPTTSEAELRRYPYRARRRRARVDDPLRRRRGRRGGRRRRRLVAVARRVTSQRVQLVLADRGVAHRARGRLHDVVGVEVLEKRGRRQSAGGRGGRAGRCWARLSEGSLDRSSNVRGSPTATEAE